MLPLDLFWKRLLAGTIPVHDSVLTGRVPVNNSIKTGNILVRYTSLCDSGTKYATDREKSHHGCGTVGT